MIHDPFCPGPKCASVAPFGECFGYEDCDHCQCSFIAKIRADERSKYVTDGHKEGCSLRQNDHNVEVVFCMECEQL